MNRRKFLEIVGAVISSIVIVPLLISRLQEEKEKFIVKSVKDLPIFSYSSKSRKCYLECKDGYFHTKTLSKVRYINRDIYNYIMYLESCGIPIG